MANASRVLLTPVFRMSFPNLWEPRPFMKNGKPRGEPNYNLQMMFEPADLLKFKLYDESTGNLVDSDIARVLVDIAKEKWPDINVKEAVAAKDLKWPIKSGDDIHAKKSAAGKKGTEFYQGLKIISAKSASDYPPMLSYKEKGEIKRIARGTDSGAALAKNFFSGGNYAFAELNVKASEMKDDDDDVKKYLSFYVNSVRFVKEGERIGGGGGLMDRFEGVNGGETDYDPTKDMDDEIPY